MKKISLVLIICLSLSGCYNYKEIRDSAVVTAISIDTSDNAKYKVGAEIIKAGSQGSELENQVLTVDCNSLSEGLSGIVKLVNKNVYLGYCELVILGSDFAEKGIADILDYFIRNTEYRNDMLLLIAKDIRAEEILNSKNVEQKIIGHGLSDSLKADENFESTSVYSKLYKILNETETENCSAIISVLTKTSVNDEDIIKISGSSYFYEDKLAGFLSEEETFVINMINDDVKTGVFTSDNGDSTLGVKLFDADSKIKLKNNKVCIYLDIAVSVTEDSNRAINEEEYSKIISSDMCEKIYDLLKRLKNDKNVDLIGLYSKVNMKSDEFRDYLENLSTEVKVNVDIKGSGINEYYS